MNLHLQLLANVIIHQYFHNSRCLIIFTDEFNNLSYNGDIPAIKISIKNKHMQSNLIFNYFGCQGIVIYNNSPIWTVQTFEKLIKMNMERFNQRRYLILPGQNSKDNLTTILESQEFFYVPDVVIVHIENQSLKAQNKQCLMIGEEEETIYSLWTHRYIGNGNNSEKIFLDTWSSSNRTFRSNNNLYPNKLVNQMGRVLKMATFQYEPYSIIGLHENEHKGSEMSVAMAFSKKYNMTAVPIVNPEDYWGEIFKNGSGNGLLGNLVLDKADIGFSALYTWEATYHFLDLSKPLVRTGITCLVPAPRLAAGWLTPLYSYTYQMWIAVGIVFFMSVLSLFFLHSFYSDMLNQETSYNASHLFGSSVFTIIKLFVLQVVTKEEIPKGINGKYMMGLLFMFSLFLTSTYSSGLSSIMTLPRYENPIDTVEQFADSGLSWGATQEAWISSIENTEEPMYKKIVAKFVATSEEHLEEHSKTGEFAFSLERLPHENFAVGTYINEDVIGNFHLMRQDLYWEQCVIMTRKSSILLPMLDSFILRVFQSGLIGYWQNEAVSLYMDAKVQQAVKYYYHHQERIVVKLKWSHVQGAFAILCLGYISSVGVFFLENFLNKLQYKKCSELRKNQIIENYDR